MVHNNQFRSITQGVDHTARVGQLRSTNRYASNKCGAQLLSTCSRQSIKKSFMNEDQIKHILVIRFRRVGDAILTSALCSSLRKTFPNAQIDYVVNEGIDSLFRNHPDIDRLITFNA